MTAPRSVPINLEDVCNRLTQRLADATAQLVVAESTRDAALKENDELKAELAALAREDDLKTPRTGHFAFCALDTDHDGDCRADGDDQWRTDRVKAGPDVG